MGDESLDTLHPGEYKEMIHALRRRVEELEESLVGGEVVRAAAVKEADELKAAMAGAKEAAGGDWYSPLKDEDSSPKMSLMLTITELRDRIKSLRAIVDNLLTALEYAKTELGRDD